MTEWQRTGIIILHLLGEKNKELIVRRETVDNRIYCLGETVSTLRSVVRSSVTSFSSVRVCRKTSPVSVTLTATSAPTVKKMILWQSAPNMQGRINPALTIINAISTSFAGTAET